MIFGWGETGQRRGGGCFSFWTFETRRILNWAHHHLRWECELRGYFFFAFKREGLGTYELGLRWNISEDDNGCKVKNTILCTIFDRGRSGWTLFFRWFSLPLNNILFFSCF